MPNYYTRRLRVEALKYTGHSDIDALKQLLDGTYYTVGNKIPQYPEGVWVLYASKTAVAYSIYPGCCIVKYGKKVELLPNDLFDAKYEPE